VKSSKKLRFGRGADIRGREYPILEARFQIALIFEHWPVVVEFRSARSEDSWRKKDRRKNRGKT